MLARVIDENPAFDPEAWIQRWPPLDLFGALVLEVIGQQISVAAATAIFMRLLGHFSGAVPNADHLATVDPAVLHQLGLSRQKSRTVHEPAERFRDGRLSETAPVFLPGHHAGRTWLSGSATCESGRPIIAIWIAALAGQQGSGYAHLGPAPAGGLSHASGPTVSYTYPLAQGGSYVVHVGCGGTSRHWDSTNYSGVISSPSVTLRCADPAATPPPGKTLNGHCTPTH
ncbi:MAG TPA: hypothetical protein VGH27_29330 [Streptosporangiaceae bacterium]